MIDLITPFEHINPCDYDEVITELQKRVRKAERVIKLIQAIHEDKGSDEIDRDMGVAEILKDYK